VHRLDPRLLRRDDLCADKKKPYAQPASGVADSKKRTAPRKAYVGAGLGRCRKEKDRHRSPAVDRGLAQPARARWCVTTRANPRKPTGACLNRRRRHRPASGSAPSRGGATSAGAYASALGIRSWGTRFYATVPVGLSTPECSIQKELRFNTLRAGHSTKSAPKRRFKRQQLRERAPEAGLGCLWGIAEGLIIQRPNPTTALDLGKVLNPVHAAFAAIATRRFHAAKGRAPARGFGRSSSDMPSGSWPCQNGCGRFAVLRTATHSWSDIDRVVGDLDPLALRCRTSIVEERAKNFLAADWSCPGVTFAKTVGLTRTRGSSRRTSGAARKPNAHLRRCPFLDQVLNLVNCDSFHTGPMCPDASSEARTNSDLRPQQRLVLLRRLCIDIGIAPAYGWGRCRQDWPRLLFIMCRTPRLKRALSSHR